MTRYAFLGPAGTFSEEALLSMRLPECELVACATIGEVFEAVERGRAEAGVVPIENSTDGRIVEARLALGGVHERPVRMGDIEAATSGRSSPSANPSR